MNIGIICEYNPFHYGHLYHLNKIAEEFGDKEITIFPGQYEFYMIFMVTNKKYYEAD